MFPMKLSLGEHPGHRGRDTRAPGQISIVLPISTTWDAGMQK